MSSRKSVFSSFGRGAALATAAAVALAAIEPSVAMAGTATHPSSGLSVNHGSSGSTDISAARRRHYHGNGGAAAMAAFAGIVGTIGGIAAAQERRDYYESGPAYYGGGPAYYGGGPTYYGGGPVYYNSPGYGYYCYGGQDTYDRPDRTYN
jgi:hypothetical protein